MAKKILVTASNQDETRVAVLEGNELTNYDSERPGKKPIKGNVYLAKVVRIEPSLQAVFIDYGGEKNGFLAFTEIHPDYYKIPVDDVSEDEDDEFVPSGDSDHDEDSSEGGDIDPFAYPDMQPSSSPNNVTEDKEPKHKKEKKRHYNVQEVIHNKQVLLVQAIKDVRGNKCAAFTTFLSFPGQYCVLMPNSGGERSGGVSRRVHEDETRQRLKDVLNKLKIPDKMSLIIRTAGQERTKLEIRKDYEYLMRVWDEIREKTLESNAPAIIHEDAAILMRVVRDFYKKDIDEILVDTQDAYKQLRIFMRQLSPSGVRKIKLYKDTNISLFNSYNVEDKIIAMVSPRVPLPSGGSLVIGQTEALVAIDVNSGRATKERHIDSTALKTNLEAAKEIAKQLRLRDLSGLIVIDFIDMWENKHIKQVEQFFRAELASDRSRIQTGNISQFGLMEMSRQRLRSSVMEMYSERCPHCQGRGTRYSCDYFASAVLNLLEKSAEGTLKLTVSVPRVIAELLVNKKRKEIHQIETKYHCTVTILSDSNLSDEEFILDDGINEPSVRSLGKTSDDQEENKQIRTVHGFGKKIVHDSKIGKNRKHHQPSRATEGDEQRTHVDVHDEAKEDQINSAPAKDNSNEDSAPNGNSHVNVQKNDENVDNTSKNPAKTHGGPHKELDNRRSQDERPRHRRKGRSPYGLIQHENQRTSVQPLTSEESSVPKELSAGTSDKAVDQPVPTMEKSAKPARVEKESEPPKLEKNGQKKSPVVKLEKRETEKPKREPGPGPLDNMSMMEPYRQKTGVKDTVRKVFGRLVGKK
ncbi:MAG: Rne/Rng family ribonuclease [Holosporales bacterium]|jgi:ribonuclease E|nr:Rne/Rng family ribonuclease [Holosporales bacterium]